MIRLTSIQEAMWGYAPTLEHTNSAISSAASFAGKVGTNAALSWGTSLLLSPFMSAAPALITASFAKDAFYSAYQYSQGKLSYNDMTIENAQKYASAKVVELGSAFLISKASESVISGIGKTYVDDAKDSYETMQYMFTNIWDQSGIKTLFEIFQANPLENAGLLYEEGSKILSSTLQHSGDVIIPAVYKAVAKNLLLKTVEESISQAIESAPSIHHGSEIIESVNSWMEDL